VNDPAGTSCATVTAARFNLNDERPSHAVVAKAAAGIEVTITHTDRASLNAAILA
jgi:hypothetical protein